MARKRGAAVEDLSGRRFGRLTAISFADLNKHRMSLWLCRCDCGNFAHVSRPQLIRGRSKSCGCLHHDAVTKHGHSATRSPTYSSYQSIRSRCLNPSAAGYERYGGRGIKVCARWLEGEDGRSGFECFLADMGERPPRTTIERGDVNGNYTPSNCHWAGLKAQSLNRRDVRVVTYRGERLSVFAACKKAGVHYGTALNRLNRGLPFDGVVEGTCTSL